MKNSIAIRIFPMVLLLGLSSCEKEYLTPQDMNRTSGIELQHAPTKPTLDAPIISCGTTTQASIYLTVKAGASGAPAGFSIQWVPKSVLAANNNIWDGLSSSSADYCAGSFSGNANLSRYNLVGGASVEINIGELLFDNGASTSTSCKEALSCGTEYAFRAFAHATRSQMRSDFTALDLASSLCCTTLPCSSNTGCTYTQGYWKTHGPIPTGNNSNEWAVSSLTLGSVVYTDLQLQSILDKPAMGNGLIVLAHQLIAAKLNIANGSSATAIAASIAAADALIGGLSVPPVGGGNLAPSATSALTTALAHYNEGLTGLGHCD